MNAYVAIDERGVITAWNREAARIFGRPSAAAIGRELTAVIIPERHRAVHRLGLARYVQAGKALELGDRIELTGLRADGSEFPIEITIGATEQHGRRAFHVFIEDIASRRTSEAERRLLATVVGCTRDAVSTVDADGIITSWNEGAERLYGYSAQEMIGRCVIEPSTPGTEQANQFLPRLLAGEHLTETGLPRPRKDGSLVYVDLTGAPLRDEDGRIVGAAAIARDVTERVQRDQELRRLATVVEQSDDAILVKSLEGLITEWNHGAEQLYGYRADEAIGQAISMLVPIDRRGEEAELLRRAAAGETSRIETTRVRQDGVAVEVSLTVTPVLDADGNPVAVAVIARDITETRRVARELEAIFDNVPSPLVLRDREGRYRHVNAQVTRSLGVDAQDLIGRSPDAHYSQEVMEEIRAQDDEMIRSREPLTHEITVPHADGTLHDYHVVKYPVLDADGEVTALGSFSLDITERKQAERRLSAAEKRFRGLLEAAPDAIVIANDRGEIVLVNARVEEQFGYERGELIGKRVEVLMPKRVHSRHARHRERFQTSPRARAMGAGLELLARRKDGSEFPVEISLSPLQTDEGALVSAAIRDVSARKRVERERERALEELEEAQEIAGLGSWWCNPSADVTTWSAEMYRIFDRSPEHGPATSEEFLAYVHPEDRERMAAGYAQAFGGGPGFELDYRISAGDGTERIVHALGREDPHQPGCCTGTVQDVTELRAVERAAREAEERFRRAFDDAPIGVALISLDGEIKRTNRALAVTCGRTRGELEGERLRALVHPADREQADQALRALAGGESERVSMEFRFAQVAGAPVDVHAQSTLLRDAAGQPSQLLCQFQDVTDRKRFEAKLQFMADHDPLTGLVNRRKFEAELGRHVAQVKRYGAEGALIVLDIDHFKSVNDKLGHTAGDELIVSIAGVLQRRLRESDVVARLGGDEFAVLLPKADADEAAYVVQAIVHAVRSHTVLLGDERKGVTTSAGVTMFDRTDQEGLSGESILIEADLAMYDAKEAGRDGYAFYETSPHRAGRTKARLTWAGRIERALEHDGFRLLAQPILDLRTDEIHHHELLIRMLDERGELIPPATFLYIAERFGLIARIDEWVSGRAIDLIERHPSLRLSVNISGRSLGDDRLLEAITQPLRAGLIDPGKLTFEVTETGAVSNISEAQIFAQQLRDLGCHFALDDFGAGFGSFYYLKHLPFDYVKIDGEFVQHAVSGRIDQLVIKAIVGIAQGLGEETIAEFVTSEQTKRMVKGLGVDYAQGYHIGKPISLDELLPAPAGDMTRSAQA